MAKKGGWEYNGDFSKALERLAPECDKAVAVTAGIVVNRAGNKAPKKSGALSKSGYVIAKGKNTFEEAKSEAGALNSEVQFVQAEPEREQTGVSTATIGFATDYAQPVHDGHLTRSGSFVAPRPFLANQMNASEEILEKQGQEALERAFKKR